ncbi:class I SAM-dependent DNA methyltransferase [Microbacterium sp. A93]|uniref:class I SAM-dependent DNA methyltransferase n=1 Tax=Microbacterium sp. A93 TaxID=3450716 RepID=UPI003F43F4DF
MTDASMTATHPGGAVQARDGVEDTGYGREFAPFYDRIFQHDEFAEITADGLARIHPDIAQGTLELGVGTGRIALPLARRIGPVDAVDSSVEMLALLEGHRDGEPVHATHGNFVHELPDRRYGMIFAVCQTMSMVGSRADQRRAMHRVAQTLAPGGIFVVETGNPLQVHALMGGQNPAVTTVPLEAQGGWLTTYSQLTESEAGDEAWRCRQIWIERDGTLHTGVEQSLLTPVEVMDQMATEAGLVPELLFATWSGAPYGDEAPLYIRSYRRPPEAEPVTREGAAQ